MALRKTLGDESGSLRRYVEQVCQPALDKFCASRSSQADSNDQRLDATTLRLSALISVSSDVDLFAQNEALRQSALADDANDDDDLPRVYDVYGIHPLSVHTSVCYLFDDGVRTLLHQIRAAV